VSQVENNYNIILTEQRIEFDLDEYFINYIEKFLGILRSFIE